MIKYIVYTKGRTRRIGKYDSLEEAQKFAINFINKVNKHTNDTTPLMTIFDLEFDTEELSDTPQSLIPNYTSACKYLHIEAASLEFCFGEGDNKTLKATYAFYQLSIIAKAWNKMSGFKIDLGNNYQPKYYPIFEYNNKKKKFNFSSVVCTLIRNSFCFKTKDLAIDFGKMFNDLYNKIIYI